MSTETKQQTWKTMRDQEAKKFKLLLNATKQQEVHKLLRKTLGTQVHTNPHLVHFAKYVSATCVTAHLQSLLQITFVQVPEVRDK